MHVRTSVDLSDKSCVITESTGANAKKRSRQNSSASSTSSNNTSLKPSLKMARLNSPSKPNAHVTFLLQNNAVNNDNSSADTSGPEQSASTTNNTGGAQATANPLLTTYKVNSMALPMWRSTRNNRIAEHKAGLRAAAIQELLDNDVVPSFFLGAEKLPAYFNPLSQEMADLIRTQGRDLAVLAIQDLRERERVAKKRVTLHSKIWKELYDQEGDDTSDEAQGLADRLVTHFQAQETKRLKDLTDKEKSKKPTTTEDLCQLVVKEYIPPNQSGRNDRANSQERPNSRPNSRERGRKHARANSRDRARDPNPNPQQIGADNNATPNPNPNNNLPRQGRPQQQQRQNYNGQNAGPNNRGGYNNRGRGNNNNPGPRGGDNPNRGPDRGRGRGRGYGQRLNPGVRDIIDALSAFSHIWKNN
jgi:uncharacterized membrane protein